MAQTIKIDAAYVNKINNLFANNTALNYLIGFQLFFLIIWMIWIEKFLVRKSNTHTDNCTVWTTWINILNFNRNSFEYQSNLARLLKQVQSNGATLWPGVAREWCTCLAGAWNEDPLANARMLWKILAKETELL